MDRTLPSRLTALLAAMLFLFSWTGDALGWHACPHHSTVPGTRAHAVAEAPAGHGAHGGHAAPAQVAADHDGPALPSHPEGAHSCTCMGSCPSAAGEALPALADAGLRVAPASVREARPDAPAAVHPRLVPFFLPYGQAPPLLG